MTKKETAKFVIQVIVSIASAILTALGATSCTSTPLGMTKGRSG